jgi:hypothetical protein
MGAALFLGVHFQEFDPLPIEEGCVHIFEGKDELDPIDDFCFWPEYPRILDQADATWRRVDLSKTEINPKPPTSGRQTRTGPPGRNWRQWLVFSSLQPWMNAKRYSNTGKPKVGILFPTLSQK